MLNEGDIELIHEWRDEMLSHRQRPVTVFFLEKQRDPLTGAVIGEQEESREVIAVVTELSIKKANGSRSLDGSFFYEEGDIKVDISIELVRSEEHTSELQSRGHLVCRLRLGKPTISTEW